MISNFDKVDSRIKVFQLGKFILIYSYNFLFIRFVCLIILYSLYLQLDILFGIKYIRILQFFYLKIYVTKFINKIYLMN